MASISQTIFSDAFSWIKKKSILIKISLTFVPRGPLDNNPVDNGLAPNGQQAIIWTNAYLFHWRIYAAQGGNDLIHECQNAIPAGICGYTLIVIVYHQYGTPYCALRRSLG